MTSDVTIRELDPARDAEAVVAILRAANPQWLLTPDSWRYDFEHAPERAAWRGWVATRDTIVGVAVSGRDPWTSEPGVGRIRANVRADSRRRGIGSRLYEVAEKHVLGIGSRRLLTTIVEDDAALRFAAARGFAPGHVAVHSRVDPTTVDVSPLEGLPAGVRVTPLAELTERLEEVCDVVREAVLDEPGSVQADAFRYAEFLDEIQNPLSSWDATFCTLVEDEIVTFAGAMVDPATSAARNGFTGTRRRARGKGYATFAKLASIRRLAETGYRALWTGNDETNAAMLAVNTRLGYRPALRTVEVVRTVS